ncbi:hypothetical protein ACFFIX_13290 [Metabacillus herbersteinensis]|uniref:Uncharacterized protein n=1 Tax=Metabacillus herbersteinensis TaxID=283816 RepID=A0ABV6GGU8_9BACI
MFNNSSSFLFGKYALDGLDMSLDTKQSTDRYDVYVNQDYVGQKLILTSQEEVHDIDDFLENEGFKNFESTLDGDHYYVKATQNERAVADTLKVYLQNR